ncbi:hypothetical protein SUGI_0635020 [Cryptomeria japonica]|nr:hypothetical protein SUGI_0635020 [Cryptomeria japonica]
MKQPSEAAWKLRFRQMNRLRLKARLHRALKSARNLSLHRSFCLRKSAFSRCKFKAFSFKTSSLRRRSSPRSYADEEQSVEHLFETLRTLVPGSFGLDTPIFLEKAADYITALKMQVEAMQTLVNLLENPARGAVSWPS